MATMSVVNNKMVLPINSGFSSTGAITKTLKTAGKFVDKDIEVNVQVPNAVYEAAEGGDTTATITVSENSMLSDTATKYPIDVTASASVSAGTMKVKTPGWTNASINVDSGSDTKTQTLYIKEGSISANGNQESYTEKDVELNIADGYLYIDEGYLPSTKISLDALIPDLENDAASEHILQGHQAYDEKGKVIDGTMGYSNVGSTKTNPTISNTVNNITVGANTVTPTAGDSSTYTVAMTASVTGSSSVNVQKGYVDENSTLNGTINKSNSVNTKIKASTHTETLGTATTSKASVNITMAKACSTTGYNLDGVLSIQPASGTYLTIGATAAQATAGNFSNTVTSAATEGYTQGYSEITTVSGSIGVNGADNASYILVYTGEVE